MKHDCITAWHTRTECTQCFFFFLKCTIPALSGAIERSVYVAAREQGLPELCEKSRANLIRAAITTACRPAGASLRFFTAAHRSPPIQPSSHRHAPDMNEASGSMVSMNYWELVVRLEATLYSICFAAAFRFLALTHLNPPPLPPNWPRSAWQHFSRNEKKRCCCKVDTVQPSWQIDF